MMTEPIGYATYRHGGESIHGELAHDEATNWLILHVPIFDLEGTGIGTTKYLITSGCFELLEKDEYLARLRIRYKRMVRDSQSAEPKPRLKTEVEELREQVGQMALLLKKQAYDSHPGLIDYNRPPDRQADIPASHVREDPRIAIEKRLWEERARNPPAEAEDPWAKPFRPGEPIPDSYSEGLPKNMLGFSLIEGSSRNHYGDSTQLPKAPPPRVVNDREDAEPEGRVG
jgi:hypothetical protein